MSRSVDPQSAVPISIPLPTSDSFLTIFPLRRANAPAELVAFLAATFNAVVAAGRTYPHLQEHSLDEFADYFFQEDCFVGLQESGVETAGLTPLKEGGFLRETNLSIDSVLAGRSWQSVTLGFFYVKPNYIGRSSHLCNAGFIVPESARGQNIGKTLGRAYLHFGPLLGYRGSVFNLVYASNVASSRIWDSLGFERAGLIPGAGRLKSLVEGGEDDYVDAIVYYKSFAQ